MLRDVNRFTQHYCTNQKHVLRLHDGSLREGREHSSLFAIVSTTAIISSVSVCIVLNGKKYFFNWLRLTLMQFLSWQCKKLCAHRKREREIMNGQWLCIKLNMKNWAYRSANITTAALLKLKNLTNVLEYIYFLCTIMNEK